MLLSGQMILGNLVLLQPLRALLGEKGLLVMAVMGQAMYILV